MWSIKPEPASPGLVWTLRTESRPDPEHLRVWMLRNAAADQKCILMSSLQLIYIETLLILTETSTFAKLFSFFFWEHQSETESNQMMSRM